MANLSKAAGRPAPCKVALPHEFPRTVEQLAQNEKFLKDEIEKIKCNPAGATVLDCATLLDLLRSCPGVCSIVCNCDCDEDSPFTPKPPIPNPTVGRPYAVIRDPFGQVWISEAGRVSGPGTLGPNGWVVDPVANVVIETLVQPNIVNAYGLVYVPPTQEVWLGSSRAAQRIAVDIYDARSRLFKRRLNIQNFGQFCIDLAWTPDSPGVVYCATTGPNNEILWLDAITGGIVGQTVVNDDQFLLAESMVPAHRTGRIFCRLTGNFLTSFAPGDALTTGPLPSSGVYIGASGQSRNAVEMGDGRVYWHPERIDFVMDMPLEGASPASFQDVGGGDLQMFNTELGRVQGFTVFANPAGDVLGTVSTERQKVSLVQLDSLREIMSADLGFAGGRATWVEAIDGFGVVLRAHTEDDPADMTTLVRFWGRGGTSTPPIDAEPGAPPAPGNGGTVPDLDTVYTAGCSVRPDPILANINEPVTLTAHIGKLVTHPDGFAYHEPFPGVVVRLVPLIGTDWIFTGQGGVTDAAGNATLTVTKPTFGTSLLDLYATAPGYPEVKTGAHPYASFG